MKRREKFRYVTLYVRRTDMKPMFVYHNYPLSLQAVQGLERWQEGADLMPGYDPEEDVEWVTA